MGRKFIKLCEDDIFGIKWYTNRRTYLNKDIAPLFNLTVSGVYWLLNEDFAKRGNERHRLRNKNKRCSNPTYLKTEYVKTV